LTGSVLAFADGDLGVAVELRAEVDPLAKLQAKVLKFSPAMPPVGDGREGAVH
jgi:hypothetical protein